MSPKILALFLTLALAGALPALAGDPDTSEPPVSTAEVDLPVLGAEAIPTSELRALARDGGLTLLVQGREVALTLQTNPLVAPGAPVRENGRDVAAPDIDLYRGTVLGDPDSHARVSVTDHRASGYVYAFGTMYDLATIDGDAVLKEAAAVDRPTLIDYEVGEVEGLDPLGEKQGIGGCLGPVPEVTTDPLGLISGWSTGLTYDVITVSDKPFTQRYSDWGAAQLAHMNRIDGYYTSNFNIQIRVVAQSADTAGTIYTSSSSDGLLNQLRNAWYADTTDRDTVHLLSQRDFSGSTVGQAWCIGGAHSPLLHYTVTQTQGFSEYGASEITAHELGHMMSAHHHYSNCHELALSPSTQPCTVMTPAVNFMHNAILFSMLSRSTIREYGEDVL